MVPERLAGCDREAAVDARGRRIDDGVAPEMILDRLADDRRAVPGDVKRPFLGHVAAVCAELPVRRGYTVDPIRRYGPAADEELPVANLGPTQMHQAPSRAAERPRRLGCELRLEPAVDDLA